MMRTIAVVTLSLVREITEFTLYWMFTIILNLNGACPSANSNIYNVSQKQKYSSWTNVITSILRREKLWHQYAPLMDDKNY